MDAAFMLLEQHERGIHVVCANGAVLVGDADYPPLIQASRQAAARIPGCELTVVPGMDHLPPLREPGLVLRTITSTLARAGW